MAINQVEDNSCTLQIIRESNGSSPLSYSYDNIKNSELMNFALKIQEKNLIPLLNVDLTSDSRDIFQHTLLKRPSLQLRYM